jgi:hypothetical protein
MLSAENALNSVIIAITHVKSCLNALYIGENMREKTINALLKAIQP